MAIRGTLTLDTSSFDRALDTATQHLKSVEVSGKGAQASLQRMFNSFEGGRLIAEAKTLAKAVEAVGGASKLTQREMARVNSTVTEAIAKYHALGREAPADLVKLATATSQAGGAMTKLGGIVKSTFGQFLGAMSVQAIFSDLVGSIGRAAKEAVDFGGQLTDLSAKTGLSVGALQEYGYAAKQTGGSLEGLTASVFKLQQKIGEGSTDTKNAVKDLGLSFESLRRLSPEQQFSTIATALGEVKDQVRFAEIGVSLFGKGFSEIAPTIKQGFSELVDEARELGLILNDDLVAALDNLGDKEDRLHTEMMVRAAEHADSIYLIKTAYEELKISIVEALGLAVRLAKQAVPRGREAAPPYRPENFMGPYAISGPTSGVTIAPPPVVQSAKELAEAQKAAADATRKHAEQVQRLDRLAWSAYQRSLLMNPAMPAQWALGSPGFSVGGPSASDPWGGLFGGGTRTNSWFQTGVGQLVEQTVTSGLGDLFSGFQDITRQVLGARPGTGSLASFVFSGASGQQFGKTITQSLLAALQGGGNVAGTLAVSLGTTFSDRISDYSEKLKDSGKSLTFFQKALGVASAGVAAFATGYTVGRQTGSRWAGAISGAASGAVAGMPLAGATGGWSIAIGAAAGFVGGWLGGGSQKAKDLRRELLATAGGMAELQRQADLAGMSLDLMMSTDSAKTFNAQVAQLNALLAIAREKINAIGKDLTSLTSTGGLMSPDLFLRIFEMRDKADVQTMVGQYLATQTEQGLAALTALAQSAAPVTAQVGTAMAGAAAALFQQLREMGATTLEALKQMEPAIVALSKKLGELGIGGGGAFDQLANMAGLARDEFAGPLVDSVDQVGKLLTALANTGWLTEEMFQGLASQAGGAYTQLIAGGKNADDVLRLMAPSLQRIWELQQRHAWAVDATTQALIDEAVAQGIVGEEFKSAQDQMLAAINKLIERLGVLINHLLGPLVNAAEAAAAGINNAFDTIQPPKYGIVQPDDQGGVYAARGGLVARLASGGWPFTPSGTDTVPAMLTPGEYVLSAPAARALGADTLATLNSGRVPGGVVSVPITVYGGHLTEDQMIELESLGARIGKAIARAAWRDEGGVRVDLRHALGI